MRWFGWSSGRSDRPRSQTLRNAVEFLINPTCHGRRMVSGFAIADVDEYSAMVLSFSWIMKCILVLVFNNWRF